MSPSPWTSRYVGAPWVAGEAECWHLVVRVLREVFGIRDLPLAAAGDDPRAARRLIAEHPERAAWAEVAEAREGDVVTMRRGLHPCHLGVWVAPAHVLHAVRGPGAILTPAARLPDLGYRIAGTFRRVRC